MYEELDRYHIVRVCREYCIEEGYSGESFIECVENCVSKYLSNNKKTLF